MIGATGAGTVPGCNGIGAGFSLPPAGGAIGGNGAGAIGTGGWNGAGGCTGAGIGPPELCARAMAAQPARTVAGTASAARK